MQDPQGRPFAVLGRFVASDEIKRLEGALTLAEDRLDDITRLVRRLFSLVRINPVSDSATEAAT